MRCGSKQEEDFKPLCSKAVLELKIADPLPSVGDAWSKVWQETATHRAEDYLAEGKQILAVWGWVPGASIVLNTVETPQHSQLRFKVVRVPLCLRYQLHLQSKKMWESATITLACKQRAVGSIRLLLWTAQKQEDPGLEDVRLRSDARYQ